MKTVVGVVATLLFQTVQMPGGFIHVAGCSLSCLEGLWYIDLKWYLSKTAFDQNEFDVKSDGFPRLDPMPYVNGNDPIMDAANSVKTWFPDGVVVTE